MEGVGVYGSAPTLQLPFTLLWVSLGTVGGGSGIVGVVYGGGVRFTK